jgi:hypothetical protein
MKKDKRNERNERFIKRVQDKFGDVYNLLEEYQRCSVKMQVQHKCEDGDWYTWGITPSGSMSKMFSKGRWSRGIQEKSI